MSNTADEKNGAGVEGKETPVAGSTQVPGEDAKREKLSAPSKPQSVAGAIETARVEAPGGAVEGDTWCLVRGNRSYTVKQVNETSVVLEDAKGKTKTVTPEELNEFYRHDGNAVPWKVGSAIPDPMRLPGY